MFNMKCAIDDNNASWSAINFITLVSSFDIVVVVLVGVVVEKILSNRSLMPYLLAQTRKMVLVWVCALPWNDHSIISSLPTAFYHLTGRISQEHMQLITCDCSFPIMFHHLRIVIFPPHHMFIIRFNFCFITILAI